MGPASIVMDVTLVYDRVNNFDSGCIVSAVDRHTSMIIIAKTHYKGEIFFWSCSNFLTVNSVIKVVQIFIFSWQGHFQHEIWYVICFKSLIKRVLNLGQIRAMHNAYFSNKIYSYSVIGGSVVIFLKFLW